MAGWNMENSPATLLRGVKLLDKELEGALAGISNAHYATLEEMANSAVCHRKGLLDAWKAMVNNTSILMNNLTMKGILNLVLNKGTDPTQLSYLEYDIVQRRAAHDRMLRELEAEIHETRPGEPSKARGGTKRSDQQGSPNKNPANSALEHYPWPFRVKISSHA